MKESAILQARQKLMKIPKINASEKIIVPNVNTKCCLLQLKKANRSKMISKRVLRQLLPRKITPQP